MFVEPVDDTIETLRKYAEQKVVDKLAIEPWPDEIRLAGEPGTEQFREQYDRFRAWADRQDASLEPGFLHRERTTLVSESRDQILSPPVLCLAIHVDDELVGVAPHHTGTGVYTIEDALTDIERLASESARPGQQ